MDEAYHALELVRIMKQEVSEREDVKQLMNTDERLRELYKRAIDAASDLEEFMRLVNV